MNVSYTKNQQFFSSKRVDGGVASRQFAETYQSIRQHSINLTVSLSVEDMAVQSMPEASPIKWHLAQTTWFFEKYLLARFVKDYLPFHPAFTMLFNPSSGMNLPRGQRSVITRPTLTLVRTYRTHVDNAVMALIKNMPDEAYPILELGLQREQQTQELMLTDIKHLLGSNPFHPTYINKPLAPAEKVATLKMLELRGGQADIGHPGLTFCFENELPKHRVFLNPFAIADRKITNGEYLAFINAGGYSETRWWLEEGAEWRQREHIKAPLYWRMIDDIWHEYTLHGLMPLDLNRPVCHVSYFEAEAFARFSGARLPTEFEWEFAANSIIPELPGLPGLPTLTDAPVDANKQMEELILHPKGASSATGLKQFFTDTWEWTSSSYAPYPAVKLKNDAAVDHYERQMVNQYVLRGGSVATPPAHSRITYRNFYPTQTRWQFTGIRLARSII
ncbi:ergothioneine biosynthesis protein EgtB [Solimicrobium silvestre]|uniref:Ergothioneine biosynthesis protein EgtB n=1 Tax=Solimicrobium silvestre TaxID=2099400 RepID=A0A2S9GZS1_9BURK|nr:ergothioneine biosynthesis protein EgtB [Solimicrobium silvestre]PRC93200.1 Ergothioneine biosynthesis protein EgtB [Solimicrobium silvestre]